MINQFKISFSIYHYNNYNHITFMYKQYYASIAYGMF